MPSHQQFIPGTEPPARNEDVEAAIERRGEQELMTAVIPGADGWGECPWSQDAEYKPVAVGDCPTSAITAADVRRIVAHDGGGTSGFESSEIAVVELHDGRFVGWESWTDVTGSGFHHDAYGGDVEVWFARLIAELKPMFSERAWEALKL